MGRKDRKRPAERQRKKEPKLEAADGKKARNFGRSPGGRSGGGRSGGRAVPREGLIRSGRNSVGPNSVGA